MVEYDKIFIVFLLLISLASCRRYDEGGFLRSAEGNLARDWRLEKYLRNGEDQTANLLVSDYREEYTFNGEYYRIYTSDGVTVSDSGSWRISDDKRILFISGMDTISGFYSASDSIFSDEYRINKLTRNEFWYYFNFLGNRHELQMVSR